MKDKKGKIKNSKHGMVLVIAVTIIVILVFIGVGLIQLGRNARLQGVKDVLQISARSAADAGIEDAVRYMIRSWYSQTTDTAKQTWLAGWKDETVWTNPAVPATAANYISGHISLGGTFGNASFDCNIYKGTRPKGYQIISTGTAAGVTRKVHSAVILRSVFFGIGAKEKITLMPGVQLGTVPADDTFLIQTNSIKDNAITLKPNVTVPGDVVVGPGGDPDVAIDLQSNSKILGEAKAADDLMEFPPIYRPTGLPVGTPTKVGLDYYIYGNIQINGGLSTKDTLYIGNPDPCAVKGPIKVYSEGYTDLKTGANIIVNEGYSLELYLGGNMYSAPKVEIIYTTAPHITDAQIIDAAKRISIKGTTNQATGIPDCTSVLFQPNGDFYGTVYVPDAALTLKPGGTFYGAIVGGMSIDMYPGHNYMFIPSLVDLGDVEVLYMGIKHGSWWEE